MSRHDDTSESELSPRWSWLEPMTFDADGICQEPGWVRGKTRAEIDALTYDEWKALRPRQANSRLVLISGDGVCQRPAAGCIEGHQCGSCTRQLGFGYDRLIKVRVGSFVCCGRLEGGSEWWACARCGQLYFRAG